MTFEPQLIDNTTPGESLRSGADKINSNFEAIEDELNGLTHAALPDVGTNAHAVIDEHIADTAIHAEINDSGSGTGDLWSASKIVSAIDAAVFGIGEFLDSVLDKDLTEPPVAPTDGDRYIIATVAIGDWLAHDKEVAEYAVDTWVFTEPSPGMCAYVDDEGLLYIYNGTSWSPINNYALASTEPPAISSSTSGAIGDSTTVARSNHSHDLSAHTHADATVGGTISHTVLTDKGSNTHANIDTFIGSKAAASGLASLDGSSLVVQNPANATATPTASKIVMADGSGKLASGWGGSASTLATLDASLKVVEDPANATTTPTAGKIPIADGSGKLDAWVSLSGKASTDHDATHITSGSDEIDGDKLDIDWNPANYTPATVPSYADSVDNLTAHLKGIDTALGTGSGITTGKAIAMSIVFG